MSDNKRLCLQCNTGRERCSESLQCYECGVNDEFIISLEAEIEYWKGYVHAVDDCLDGQEYYEETLTKDDTPWRPES